MTHLTIYRTCRSTLYSDAVLTLTNMNVITECRTRTSVLAEFVCMCVRYFRASAWWCSAPMSIWGSWLGDTAPRVPISRLWWRHHCAAWRRRARVPVRSIETESSGVTVYQSVADASCARACCNKTHAVVTTTIRLRFDGRSTARESVIEATVA